MLILPLLGFNLYSIPTHPSDSSSSFLSRGSTFIQYPHILPTHPHPSSFEVQPLFNTHTSFLLILILPLSGFNLYSIPTHPSYLSSSCLSPGSTFSQYPPILPTHPYPSSLEYQPLFNTHPSFLLILILPLSGFNLFSIPTHPS